MDNQEIISASTPLPSPPTLKSYAIKLRLLGNEVFAVSLDATSDSNRWIALGLVSVFCTLTILGAYGEKLMALFSGLI